MIFLNFSENINKPTQALTRGVTNKNNQMKRFNITKREIVFFFIGIITVIVINTLLNWEDCKNGFNAGWKDARNEVNK